MRLHRSFLGWGIFFIALGLVPLSVQAGWVDRSATADLWRLWPLVLVGIGVGLLLRRTALEALGGLIVAATVGLLVGGLVTTGVSLGAACGPSDGATNQSRTGSLGPGASAEIRIACGKLGVSTVPGSDWRVAWGPDGRGMPTIDSNPGTLEIRDPEGVGVFFPGRVGGLWEIALPRDAVSRVSLQVDASSANVPLDGMSLGSVSIRANAADVRVDLGAANAGELDAHVNVGSLRLGLPATGLTGGDIEANLSSVTLCAAPTLPIRIRADGALVSWELPGLTKIGDTYETPGFETVTGGVSLHVRANLGSVRLERGGTCR